MGSSGDWLMVDQIRFIWESLLHQYALIRIHRFVESRLWPGFLCDGARWRLKGGWGQNKTGINTKKTSATQHTVLYIFIYGARTLFSCVCTSVCEGKRGNEIRQKHRQGLCVCWGGWGGGGGMVEFNFIFPFACDPGALCPASEPPPVSLPPPGPSGEPLPH